MKKVLHLCLPAILISFYSHAASQNPYSTVADRNIFGLVPIPIPTELISAEPPPKITPTGIMSIFGRFQALFKVANPPHNGQPAKEESYVLGVNERQDEIEVTKIDDVKGVITFNNHGTVQELPLIAANGTSAPVPSPTPVFNGGIPAPSASRVLPPLGGFNRGGRGGNNVAQSGGFNGNADANINANANANGNGNAFGNALVSGGASSGVNSSGTREAEKLSPEAQVIMMEKNRLDTQDAVNHGTMPPLPPTVITPADATGVGGVPLVTPPAFPELPDK